VFFRQLVHFGDDFFIPKAHTFLLLLAVVAARSAPKKSFFPWDFSSETVSGRS